MLHMKLMELSAVEEGGIRSVKGKCIDITKNSSGEGDFLDGN